MLKDGSSDVAAVPGASKMDAAVNTATSLTDTTKAPIYLQQTLRIREAVVLATIPETKPRFRMWHSSISKPRQGCSQLMGGDNLSRQSNGLSESSELSRGRSIRSGSATPLSVKFRRCLTLGGGSSRSFVPSSKRACAAVLTVKLQRSK